MSYEKKFNAGFVYLICCCASLGGLMFGYSTAVISGAVSPVKTHFALSPAEVGWAVSSIIAGAIAGALMAGSIAEKTGRRTSLLISSLVFIATALLCSLASSYETFWAGRVLCGLAVGVAGTVAPMYMSEVAPTAIRARCSGLFNLAMVVGVLSVFIVNYVVVRGMDDIWIQERGWRWMMGSQLVPSVIMMLLCLLMPESPQWNLRHQRSEQAIRLYARIYPEFNSMEAQQLFAARQTRNSAARSRGGLADTPVLKYILAVGVLIAILQQCTGINVMNYYAPIVLAQGNAGKETVLFQTIFIAVANGIGGFIGMNLFDRFGRLPVMKAGTLGATLGLLIASWGLYSHDSGHLTVFGILLFMITFAMGWGAGAWVLISEIFPEKIRNSGMSLSVGLMWMTNFVITLLFPVVNDQPWLQRTFNGAFSMWIFVGFNVICYLFLARFVPETKGVPLEEIESVVAEKMARRGAHTVASGIIRQK
ncbi:sugar porter family MFS transporter [Erwinia mallotivora]|uniref:MFS transporter n=1 Tax=Erwinia mallotivora TaxID=69222 RepID=A0A014PSQ1_9GAMM|nr:sugar porter family MFS transporter [Erwinia mallotivora]EXU73892.1 MFS transporter [Erwinia mallotivora]